ncbi:unnamed protein product [Cuscuta campestris]|uniref:Uncharacterized protein n=1 Tax=Cuscuta campestris TaxID=132261 RepID=A0A484MI29_9ASTE|nr:unnamed protein product [Cuscuta campestris]
MVRKLKALEDKVDEKSGRRKHTLARSPFSLQVHTQRLRRKIKLDVEKFTGKEDPDIHLDTFIMPHKWQDVPMRRNVSYSSCHSGGDQRPPSSYQEVYNTAWEYAEAENLNWSKRELEEGYTKTKTDKVKKEDQARSSRLKAAYEETVHQIQDERKEANVKASPKAKQILKIEKGCGFAFLLTSEDESEGIEMGICNQLPGEEYPMISVINVEVMKGHSKSSLYKFKVHNKVPGAKTLTFIISRAKKEGRFENKLKLGIKN